MQHDDLLEAPHEAPADGADAFAEAYVAPEKLLVETLVGSARLDRQQRSSIVRRAMGWVREVRDEHRHVPLIDGILQEYGLSSEEGITLMRLSEALIRTPDFATARALVRDKLAEGSWGAHSGASPSAVVNAVTAGFRVSAQWVRRSGGVGATNLAARLGDKVLNAALARSMDLMANHFVLGPTIEAAMRRAGPALHSYDMLGEAAHTTADAERYFQAYLDALRRVAGSGSATRSVAAAPGLSVKLSALHPRYEYAKRRDCVPALIERLSVLAEIASRANIGLTIDAEEAERLELSVAIFEALLADPRSEQWDGLGVVIQAYQRRALAVAERMVARARTLGRRVAVRLVKGAYWDSEIKRAQELGLESYPVFTRKVNTDVSYLACARTLLDARDVIFAQFATHNAHTMSAIVEMAKGSTGFEFQRLHGMGQELHRTVCRGAGVTSRVYAPVGSHADLLPYLVRRLLENGANNSFVNRLTNPAIGVEQVVEDPLGVVGPDVAAANPAIPSPRDLFSGTRRGASGVDLTQSRSARVYEAAVASAGRSTATPLVGGTAPAGTLAPRHNPADRAVVVGGVLDATGDDVAAAIAAATRSAWRETPPGDRARTLFAAAAALEGAMPELAALCVIEAGKTLPDAVAEVREAVDFCRYYAVQAASPRLARRRPLGVVGCISPWNFPLAIFVGQVAAALAAGNAVVAKPAEQTPLIACRAVRLLHAAGIPTHALHLLPGGGEVGARIAASADVDGLCFTGSTATALKIAAARARAARGAAPLIAETGGINAMIVDSTALIEQAVRDAVASAFQSAGQRCSACRIVCVQDDIADDFIRMLAGAMALLKVGDPAELATDVGPVIDADALAVITDYIVDKRGRFAVVGETPPADAGSAGTFVGPIAFEVPRVGDVEREIFGPVLHVVRFPADGIHRVVAEINALGYGLTLGLHTRIDARVQTVARDADVGNLYVNRNQIGAVVGVQPFGGEGLSGTGPKAGGPHYLLRLSRSEFAPADVAAPAAPSFDRGLTRAEKATLRRSVAAAREAQNAGVDREALLSAVTRGLGLADDELGATPALIRGLFEPRTLPGPTGEENTLSFAARGVLVCCGGDTPADLYRQLFLALATGNAVLLGASSDVSARVGTLRRHLEAAGSPPDRIGLFDPRGLKRVLASPIDGVVADGSVAAALGFCVAKRRKTILPILSGHDAPELFVWERTLTINTTAAGGNASLLSAGEGW